MNIHSTIVLNSEKEVIYSSLTIEYTAECETQGKSFKSLITSRSTEKNKIKQLKIIFKNRAEYIYNLHASNLNIYESQFLTCINITFNLTNIKNVT